MITEQGRKFIDNGGNSAGYLDLRPEIVSEIDAALEALTDDVAPAILGGEDGFSVAFGIKDDTVTFRWTWTRLGERPREKEFRYHPCSETKEAFVNEIKAYFFDLCISLANL